VKLHKVLFWVLVFFLPTQLGRHFWPQFSFVFGLRIDYLAPTIYFTDILVIGIILSWFWEKKNKFPVSSFQFLVSRFWYVLALFFYLLLICLLAKNPGAAFYKLAKLGELFLLGFYVAKNAQLLNSLIAKVFSLAVVYQSIIAWAQFLKQGSLGGLFWFLGERSFSAGTPGIALAQLGGKIWLRPYGTFSHPNSLAGFLLVALILIWWLGKSLPFWLKVFISILGVSAILLSFSRIAWLVGLCSLAYGFWFKLSVALKKRGVRRNFTFYFLLFTFFIGLGAIFFLAPRLSGQEAVMQRLELTRLAISMFQMNPLSGVGLNNFIVHLPQFYQSGSVYLLQPVHNIFLLVAAETGLVGLVIFLWFLILTFKKLLITNYYLLITALIVILVLGLFDHYWLTLQQNQLLVAIVFGLSWSRIKA
jgi:O-antigen ligase